MTWRACLRDARGITLAEILVAVGLIGVGLAALMSVVPVAISGVQDGSQTSTATFLAQQRMEQVRNATWDATTDCVGRSATETSAPAPSPAGSCGATAVTFPDEAAVPGFPQYARTVRITDCGITPCGGVTDSALRLVRVRVTYRPMSAAGGATADSVVMLEWLVAQRL
jgi:type II secretory pathway pseudopilin PulG